MLPQFFSEIFGGIWLMDKSSADSYLPLISSILKGNFQKNDIDFSQERIKNKIRYANVDKNDLLNISEYGEAVAPEDAPPNSIAIMNVLDVISKYDMACGPSGMQTKSDILQRAYSNPNIKGIILKIDSGGGEGNAMRLFTETLAQRNKPVLGFADDLAASAAAGILTATDWAVANNDLAQVGSFGTYITVWDYTEYWKNEGIVPKEIYASQSTDKNKEYYDALKGDYSGLRDKANQFNDYFLSMVSDNRSGQLKNNDWQTGKLYMANQALEIGIIDEISSFNDTLLSFANSLNL